MQNFTTHFRQYSLHLGLSKTVLDSGFHTVDSGFQALASFRFFVSGTWIPDSLSYIPDSKAQDSIFYKQKFLGFRNRESGFSYMGRQYDLW